MQASTDEGTSEHPTVIPTFQRQPVEVNAPMTYLASQWALSQSHPSTGQLTVVPLAQYC